MYCIGLISGTSVDGIDAALVKITGTDIDLQIELIAGETFLYPEKLRKQILAVCGGASLSMAEFAELDDAIATQFALAAQRIQKENPTAQLIGSHGQTVFHRPPLWEERERGRRGTDADAVEATAWRERSRYRTQVRPPRYACPGESAFQQPSEHRADKERWREKEKGSELGYSLQLGRGEVIAHLTGIPTVCNFRAADIAAGGEGAPLVSKIDAYLLSHSKHYRCIQNLGGIGNLTYLPARTEENWEDKICGWDTGPGNALIDLAVSKLTDGQQTYDRDGNWAATGTPCQELVDRWLQQDFFQQPPPKSTGRELFSEAYLENCWQDAQAYQLRDADWLATLTEFTVASVVQSYQTFLPRMPDEVLLCGGGSRNQYLKQRLAINLTGYSKVLTTDEVGLSGDFKEAIAFAVLAYWRFERSFTGNLPQVTGAKQPMLLGDIHLPVD